jgi:hypothetical protein
MSPMDERSAAACRHARCAPSFGAGLLTGARFAVGTGDDNGSVTETRKADQAQRSSRCNLRARRTRRKRQATGRSRVEVRGVEQPTCQHQPSSGTSSHATCGPRRRSPVSRMPADLGAPYATSPAISTCSTRFADQRRRARARRLGGQLEVGHVGQPLADRRVKPHGRRRRLLVIEGLAEHAARALLRCVRGARVERGDLLLHRLQDRLALG